MSALAEDVTGVLRQGWTWWTGELAGLVQPLLRRGAAGAAPQLVASLRDGDLWLTDDGRGQAGDREKIPAALTGQAMAEQLERRSRLGGSPPLVRLRLPHSACLVRRVNVPERARGDAARILALDFERATPFSAGDVYVANYEDPIRGQPGVLTYVQLIAKRSMVQDAIARLETMGALVDAVDCWSPDGTLALPVNFLAGAAAGGTARGASPNRTAKLLAGAAIALAMSAIWISLARHQEAKSDLEHQTAAARARLAQNETTSGPGSAAIRDKLAAAKLKADRPAVVSLLDELTRLIPDSAFLTEVSIAGDAVEISGFAPRAAALVPQLERSPVFSNVSLSAPVTFDDAKGKERFSYRLQLRHATHLEGLQTAPVEVTP